MNFLAELKRRNVFRVGIAYAIGGWLVLQLTDVLSQLLTLPEIIGRVVVMVVAIGLPITLFLAWAFEMTPDGIKKEKDVDRSQSITRVTGRKLDRMIIGVLTVVITMLVVERFVLRDNPPQSPNPANSNLVTELGKTDAPVETGPSIAVLPFVNMSGDADNEYFSDGLTETLLHMLAQLPELRVAARTSSFSFKGKDTGIAEIADILRVAHILEGSVQKAGNRVRVTAQLIRADDGFHVWSQNYDRNLDDIFAIQDEIAKDVAGALDASLLGGSNQPTLSVNTANLSAYESYLKGLEQQAIFSYSSLEIAENKFKQALAHDPAFTDARLSLIRNYMMKNGTGLINDAELATLTDPLIRQVREQKPQDRLTRAFELAISIRLFDSGKSKQDRQQELTELRNLLPLLPGETYVRQIVAGMMNFYFKQPEQAIEVIQAGLLVDPLKSDLYAMLGNIYRDQGKLDLALENLQRAQQLAPEKPNIYSDLARLEKDRNNLLAALNWHRKATEIDPQDHELANSIALDLYDLNLPEEGDRWFARVAALVPDSPAQRNLEIERAVARQEYDLAISIAKNVIIAQEPERNGSFSNPLFTYTDLMLDGGKAKQAYDFLVSLRPEIVDHSALPIGVEGVMMQMASIKLMTGFESPAAREQAWLQITSLWDELGFPWRDPKSSQLLDNYVITGDIPAAIDSYLFRLSRPMATNLHRHKRREKVFLAAVYDDPVVVARLSELDREFAEFRKQVSELMQEPEWSR